VPAVRRTVTYQVAVRGQPGADLAEFKRQANETLNDARGWRRAGVAFTEVPGGGEFTLWLAEDTTMPSFGCGTYWNCQTGSSVVVNDLRWREASPAWNGGGGTLRDYRHLVINHEVGHWLGYGHHYCPGAEQPAPVMQQQSIDLQGCIFNPWPLDWEIAGIA
jgi:hypothetical protein